MATFPPEAVELLSKRVTAVVTTLLPDGKPHSVVAGVVLDGDEVVTHTGPAAKRLRNLQADPSINIVVVDPDNPMRYVEIRGTATLHEGGGEMLRQRFEQHAEEFGQPSGSDQLREGIKVVQIRVTPSKVGYYHFDPSQLGPANAQQGGGRPGGAGRPGGTDGPDVVADGQIVEDDDGRWIEFQRKVEHPADAAWAALTEPRRLVIWQHPVEFIPELRLGATIFARLNPQADAFALGKVIDLEPPRSFAFRWTTNNAQLPPEFTISYAFVDQVLWVRSGPFGPEDGILLLAASFHIHLDHLDEAITTPDDRLPSPPWPEVSVVTRTGNMRRVAQKYMEKYPELAPSGPPPGRR